MFPPARVTFCKCWGNLRRSRFSAFLLLFGLASPVSAFELVVRSAASAPGRAVEIPVVLVSQGSGLAALVFEVEYDAAKLQFDAESSKGGLGSPQARSDYSAETFTSPANGGRVGVSVYDPMAPIAVIPDGTIVTLRFLISADASGFAFVRIAGFPAPDAADAAGGKISEWNPDEEPTGVYVASARAQLIVSPRALSFGSVAQGQVAQRQLLLVNAGHAEASIQGIRLEPLAGAFSLVTLSSFPLTLRAGATLELPLRFEHDSAGRHVATLVIEQADSAAARLEVPLSASVVTEGTFAWESRFLVPAVARLPAPAGSRWRSTLAVFNPGEAAVSALLTLVATDGTSLIRELRIGAGQSKYFSDLVAEGFGLPNVSGALVIDSSSPDLVVRSTTVNEQEGGGTLGQGVPVISWADVFRSGQTAFLAGLENSGTCRTNVALLNLADSPIALEIELLEAGGETIGRRAYVLEPHHIAQSVDLFEVLGVSEKKNLVARIRALTPDAVFFAYSSTLDRRTGGPIFQSPR